MDKGAVLFLATLAALSIITRAINTLWDKVSYAAKRNRELTTEAEALRRALAEAQASAVMVCPWCLAYVDDAKRAQS